MILAGRLAIPDPPRTLQLFFGRPNKAFAVMRLRRLKGKTCDMVRPALLGRGGPAPLLFIILVGHPVICLTQSVDPLQDRFRRPEVESVFAAAGGLRMRKIGPY